MSMYTHSKSKPNASFGSGSDGLCPVEDLKLFPSPRPRGAGQAVDSCGMEPIKSSAARKEGAPSWRILTQREAEDLIPSLTNSSSANPNGPNPTPTSFINPDRPSSHSHTLPNLPSILGNPHGQPKSAPVPMHSLVESSEMDVVQDGLTQREDVVGVVAGLTGRIVGKARGIEQEELSIGRDQAPLGRSSGELTPLASEFNNTSLASPTSSTNPPNASQSAQQQSTSNSDSTAVTITATGTSQADGSRTLCVRHQMMADQGINQKLQKSLDALPTSERAAITGLWSTFSSSPHPKRKIILEGILTMCCFSQLSHLSESLGQIIRVDPFSLFPKEVCLRTLGFLDAMSLGKAAQVSRTWRSLADDDALWRRMCGQHIERKCTKCGWGLPLMERNRLKWEEEAGGRAAVADGDQIGNTAAETLDGHEHEHDQVAEGAKGSATLDQSRQGSDITARRAESRSASPWLEHPDLAVAVSNLATAFTSQPAPLLKLNPVSSARSLITRQSSKAQKRPASDSLESASTKRSRENALPPLFTGPAAESSLGAPGTSSESEADLTSQGTSADALHAVEGLRSLRSSTAISNANTTDSIAYADAEIKSRKRRKPWKHVYCERLLIERNWRKGRCTIKTLKGHTNGVMCLQFHQDLAYPLHPVLITGSYDRTARVWDMETGEVLRVLEGHTRAIRALQFDQVMLVTGSMDRTLRVWNWQTGTCLRVLQGHTDGIICLHYDKEVLASGSADSTIRVWSVANGDSFILRGHTEWVNSVLLWDGKASVSDPFSSTNVASAEPVKYLFSSSDDHSIKLWDLKSKTCLRTMQGHTGQVQSLRIVIVDRETEDSRQEAMSREATIRAESAADSGQQVTTAHCSTPFQTYFRTANIGISTSTAPANTLEANIYARAIAESEVREDFDPIAHARSRESSPSRAILHDTSSHHAGGDSLLGHGDDKEVLLISGGLDNLVKVWDVATGTEKRTLFGHIEGVWAVDVDPLRLASASHDRTIKIWDRETGKCAQTLVGHRGAVTSLQLSDDVLVSGSDDGEIRVWSFAPPNA